MNEINVYYFQGLSEVLEDNKISHSTFRLYCYITGLCNNKKGRCFASNSWFEEKMGISRSTIGRSITQLANKNYIKVEYENVQTKGTRRFIYLPDAWYRRFAKYKTAHAHQ
jgi:hypothetical protein